MSKLKRGLSMQTRSGLEDLEPFGTTRSEPFRPDELLERQTTPHASGRPPVMDDAALQALARQMNSQLGRPPRADELIQEAGGCQRKRALAAQLLRTELAQRAVRSQLLFPASIESHLRALMGEWIEHASAHLAMRHAEHIKTQDEGLYPVSTDTFEKADTGRKECLCRSEGSSLRSSSRALSSRLASLV